jgi:hypothetical protein
MPGFHPATIFRTTAYVTLDLTFWYALQFGCALGNVGLTGELVLGEECTHGSMKGSVKHCVSGECRSYCDCLLGTKANYYVSIGDFPTNRSPVPVLDAGSPFQCATATYRGYEVLLIRGVA